jgi:hypothetical protein
MVADLTEAIRPHLQRIWARAQEIFRNEVGALGEQPPEKPVEPATEAAKALKRTAAVTARLAEVRTMRNKIRAELAEKIDALDENRTRLLDFVKRMPEKVAKKMAPRLKSQTTTELVGSLEHLDTYFEEYLKRDAVKGIKKAAAGILEHEREFDFENYPELRQLATTAKALKIGKKTTLMARDLDDLRDLFEDMHSRLYQHQQRNKILTVQGVANVDDKLRDAITELDGMGTKPPAEAKGVMPETPRRPWWKRLLGLAEKTDSTIEGLLGLEDGVLSEHLVNQLGYKTAGRFFGDYLEVHNAVDKAAREIVGSKLKGEKFIKWWNEPLTFKIGGETITAARRFWMSLRLSMKDANAKGHYFARTEKGEPATWVWTTRTGKVAGKFNHVGEADAWEAEFDKTHPRSAALADAMLKIANRPGHFEKIDKVNYIYRGLHVEKVPGMRWHTPYNQAAERQPKIPDVGDWTPQDIMQQFGHHKGRLKGGRGLSMLVGDAMNTLLGEAWLDSAFVHMTLPTRNALALMGGIVHEPGRLRPINFRAYLAERIGKDVPGRLMNHIRHVAQWFKLAPQFSAGEGPVEGWMRRGLHRTVTASVSWNPFPILTQAPCALSSLADTRPIHLEHWTAALADLVAHRQEGVDDLYRLRPDICHRETESQVANLMMPGLSPTRGYSEGQIARVGEKVLETGGEGMLWMDLNTRVHDYFAFLRQLKAEGKLTGEALKQEAADLTARMMYRMDAPMHPAYETQVGREAKRSVAVAGFTTFTQGMIAQWNGVVRAVYDFQHTGKTGPLLWRLAILGVAIPTAFTIIDWLRGGKAQGRGGIAGDFAENALGNVYGAREAIRLIRAPSAGTAQPFSSPPLNALTRLGQGLVGLRNAAEKADRDRALTASVKLLRGAGALAGIPSNGVWNVARLLQRAAGTAPEKPGVSRAAYQPIKKGKRGWPARKPKPRTYAEARRNLYQKFKGRPAREWWTAVRKLRQEWQQKG